MIRHPKSACRLKQLIRTQVEHTGNADPGQLTPGDPFTAFYI